MAHINTVWDEYRKTGSQIAKDKLLVDYVRLVKYTADRIACTLPASVDRNDLISAGIFGLIKAVESFDPGRDIKFETFAGYKIRGAILDELRALDWVPRSVRQKSRTLQKAYVDLEDKLGRTPYDDEICAHLDITSREYEKMLGEVSSTTMVSLNDTLSHGSSGSKPLTLLDAVENPASENPLHVLGDGEVRRILRDAIANLPEKEKLVIALYHFEELTLKEIGLVLDITESRVSQIHSKTILKLRSKLQLCMQ